LDHNNYRTIATAITSLVPAGPVESGDSTPSLVMSVDARASNTELYL